MVGFIKRVGDSVGFVLRITAGMIVGFEIKLSRGESEGKRDLKAIVGLINRVGSNVGLILGIPVGKSVGLEEGDEVDENVDTNAIVGFLGSVGKNTDREGLEEGEIEIVGESIEFRDGSMEGDRDSDVISIEIVSVIIP